MKLTTPPNAKMKNVWSYPLLLHMPSGHAHGQLYFYFKNAVPTLTLTGTNKM
jgi:hypothetical protein